MSSPRKSRSKRRSPRKSRSKRRSPRKSRSKRKSSRRTKKRGCKPTSGGGSRKVCELSNSEYKIYKRFNKEERKRFLKRET